MALAGLVFALTGFGGIWSLIFTKAVFFACFGPIASNGTTLALEPHGTAAGSAAAALGFMQTVVPAVIASGVAALYDGTAVPMFASMLAMSTLGALIAVRRRPA